MIRTLSSWLSQPAVELGLALFSLCAVLASVLVVPGFLARLPPDYLRHPQHAQQAVLPRILRNVLGVLLIALGVLMLVLPGQGLLTLLVGVLLSDFPGKHALVVKTLGRPKVLLLVNRLRLQRGAQPLVPARPSD